MIVKLKDHPELTRVVRAADPSYRKHSAIICAAVSVELRGTYWSGGSRSSYTAVNLQTLQSSSAEQYAPAQFGGPAQTPKVALPVGVVIVKTGFFCGKQSTVTLFVNPENLAKLLPAAVKDA